MTTNDPRSIVKVKAECGHYDVFFLRPNEVMTVNEQPFSMCLTCQAANTSTGVVDDTTTERSG